MHPASMLSDIDGQMRRGWADFMVQWQAMEAGWKDQRRQKWEKDVIEAATPTLSLTAMAISDLREAIMKAAVDLRDPASSS